MASAPANQLLALWPAGLCRCCWQLHGGSSRVVCCSNMQRTALAVGGAYLLQLWSCRWLQQAVPSPMPPAGSLAVPKHSCGCLRHKRPILQAAPAALRSGCPPRRRQQHWLHTWWPLQVLAGRPWPCPSGPTQPYQELCLQPGALGGLVAQQAVHGRARRRDAALGRRKRALFPPARTRRRTSPSQLCFLVICKGAARGGWRPIACMSQRLGCGPVTVQREPTCGSGAASPEGPQPEQSWDCAQAGRAGPQNPGARTDASCISAHQPALIALCSAAAHVCRLAAGLRRAAPPSRRMPCSRRACSL